MPGARGSSNFSPTVITKEGSSARSRIPTARGRGARTLSTRETHPPVCLPCSPHSNAVNQNSSPFSRFRTLEPEEEPTSTASQSRLRVPIGYEGGFPLVLATPFLFLPLVWVKVTAVHRGGCGEIRAAVASLRPPFLHKRLAVPSQM